MKIIWIETMMVTQFMQMRIPMIVIPKMMMVLLMLTKMIKIPMIITLILLMVTD